MFGGCTGCVRRRHSKVISRCAAVQLQKSALGLFEVVEGLLEAEVVSGMCMESSWQIELAVPGCKCKFVYFRGYVVFI